MALAAFLAISCGSGRDHAYSYSSVAKGDGDDYTKERKIIYDAYLDMTCDEPDTVYAHIRRIAKKYEGYMSGFNSGSIEIRVKSKFFSRALDDIARLGKIQSKDIYTRDVTDQYVDLNIRLDNAEKTRQRYQELLKKAATVEEILKVEKELERLNEEIELLKSEIEEIDEQSDFSTITVNVEERVKVGPVGFIFKWTYKAVKWLFVRN
jgi:hypothetical protein